MVTEHNIEESRLGVGLSGWQETPWADTYYPEDLPGDWRLSYYANEFNCVHLAESAWMSASEEDWQEWLDAVDEGFRFYLSVSPEVEQERLSRVSGLLGECLGGFLLQPDDLREVPEGMRPCEAPTCVREAWQGGSGRRVYSLDIGGQDLRAQRSCLEQLAGGNTAALLLRGEGVGPDQAMQLRILAEMLGLA